MCPLPSAPKLITITIYLPFFIIKPINIQIAKILTKFSSHDRVFICLAAHLQFFFSIFLLYIFFVQIYKSCLLYLKPNALPLKGNIVVCFYRKNTFKKYFII